MKKKIKTDYDFVVNPRSKAVTGTLSCGVRVQITPTANPKSWHKIHYQAVFNPESNYQ
jgi:hypothetical protein